MNSNIIRNPKNKFQSTIDDLMDTLKNANKNKDIMLILNRRGEFKVYNYNSKSDVLAFEKQDYLIRWRMFEKNKNYHGENMILDSNSDLIQDIYNEAKEVYNDYKEKLPKKGLVKQRITKSSILKIINSMDTKRMIRILLEKSGNLKAVYYETPEEIIEYEKLDYLKYWEIRIKDGNNESTKLDENSDQVNVIYNEAKAIYKRYSVTNKLLGESSNGMAQGYIDNLRDRLDKGDDNQ